MQNGIITWVDSLAVSYEDRLSYDPEVVILGIYSIYFKSYMYIKT